MTVPAAAAAAAAAAMDIPVLVSVGRWWLFSISSLQPHIDLMHFVAATIFTFTIHSQRVVRLGHCARNLNVLGL